MTSEELEITVEIHCVELPGSSWEDRSGVHLGIQKGKLPVELQNAGARSIVFRPVLRARRHTDGSPSFLGPFAQGPRAERFIYLVWATVTGKAQAASFGRIKLHLNHLTWADLQKAAAKDGPLKVTLGLTDARGRPVFASVRADTARWELPQR